MRFASTVELTPADHQRGKGMARSWNERPRAPRPRPLAQTAALGVPMSQWPARERGEDEIIIAGEPQLVPRQELDYRGTERDSSDCLRGFGSASSPKRVSCWRT